MSITDDYGRFHALPKLLRSALYPLQIDKVSDADIVKWLTECVTAGLVSVYPAKDGKRYLEILKFGQQVRSKSKYPGNENNCLQPLTPVHLVGGVSVCGDEVVVVDSSTTSSPRATGTKKMTDGEWMETLPALYPSINLESELRKMDAWLSTRQGKQKTRRFIVNWLNRVETPLKAEGKTNQPPIW